MYHVEDGQFRYDLKKACTNCPFRNAPEGIKFACRERAEEIEELAYQEGFACHLHGETLYEDSEDSAIYPKSDGTSQHCFGALWMNLRDGWDGNIPFQRLDDENQEKWWDGMTMEMIRSADLDVYESSDDFIDASA